jgi:hypothetical protein
MRPINVVIVGLAIVMAVVLVMQMVHGAELPLPSRTESRRPTDPRCNTAARYDAMREAYQLRLPDPCSGARTWTR